MFSLNLRNRTVTFDRAAVMGIVNVTPDSFYAWSRSMAGDDIERRVRRMLDEGVDIIDIGAHSTRPGAADVTPGEEKERLARGIEALRRAAPGITVSVDTFRAEVARFAVGQLGCDMVNDVSGGTLDPAMAAAVADLQCPCVVMHMRGNPATMQTMTQYEGDVTQAVLAETAQRLKAFADAGARQLIVDPGFGFAKTLQQNYMLMQNLRLFGQWGWPVLVGISRKSMITKLLDISAEQALEASTALNAFALDRGASILRVHDVAAARQAVDLHHAINNPGL